ncbi:hypothetical protein Fmac_029293 [Flemingia macrophylla]|uniref:Uncharacterized protein n=1 Tax=Flemingia macrophylla TaxID=520843 RepID=A0ABD1L9X7_9FABA
MGLCIDLDGKAITNHLKELVSLCSVNVMEETFLIDHVKENLCPCPASYATAWFTIDSKVPLTIGFSYVYSFGAVVGGFTSTREGLGRVSSQGYRVKHNLVRRSYKVGGRNNRITPTWRLHMNSDANVPTMSIGKKKLFSSTWGKNEEK